MNPVDPPAYARAVTYCSFADDASCKGVCILQGDLPAVTAAIVAHQLGINPGGELLAMVCWESDEDISRDIFETMWAHRNKLLSEAEARSFFDAITLAEYDEENATKEER